jgi:hypothetical protein
MWSLDFLGLLATAGQLLLLINIADGQNDKIHQMLFKKIADTDDLFLSSISPKIEIGDSVSSCSAMTACEFNNLPHVFNRRERI